MNQTILTIEGVCCSGKSTLARHLQRVYGCGVIEEYGAYTESFPGLALSQTQLLENARFFINLERQRYRDSQTLGANSILILDRSFITCCAFDYAAFKDTSLERHMHIVEALWQEAVEKLVPDTVVVLAVNEENFQLRLKLSGKTLTPLLRDREFNHRFYTYLDTIPACWGKRLIWIDTNHLSESEVVSKVLENL